MKRQILISSLIVLFTAGLAKAATIHVPGAYPYLDIQDALNISQPGDVIILAPGTYIGHRDNYTGICYDIGHGITITGTDPNDPAVVAATVIDFQTTDQQAFDLHGARSVLSGITIANSHRGWHPVSDGIDPGDDGHDNDDLYGEHGINIRGSHIISNCIIRNIRSRGGPGGNGAPGGIDDDPDDPNTYVPVSDGGNGGKGGSRYGTGIYIEDGSPQILNTVIEDCVAIGGPGGNAGEGLDCDEQDPNLPGGDGGEGGWGGSAMGAGIYCSYGSSPTFKNCIIRNCQVYAGEAADGNDGGDGSLDEPNWANPGGDGGDGGRPGRALGAGVYVGYAVTATFINCQFTGNRAYGANGGDGGNSGDRHISMDEEAGQLDGGLGRSAEYRTLGAGVYIENGARATFTGCTFSGNVTRGGVGGLGGYPSTGNRESPRANLPAPTYGAGVYCASGSTTSFTDCTAQGNWTTQEPNQYPGDLYPYGSTPDPDFQLGEIEYTGYGAGMCFIGGYYAELNHCNFADNNAPVGGGVCASGLTDFHVDECNFVDNWAYLGGGLFSIDNNSTSTLSRSNFIGNRADDPEESIYGCGGGLFSFSTGALTLDCTFSENTTNGFGAGVYMAGEVAIPPNSLPIDPVLKNCLLNNNKAGIDGGGIYCDWYTEPNIINCTIAGNEAKGDPPFYVGYGGGLYCSYESDVNIINSIFWGNAGPNTIGPELAIETGYDYEPRPATVTMSHCDIKGGQGGAWVDEYSTLNWGAGNINQDPLFVNGYYLSRIEAGQMADSPCLDAGIGLAEDLGLNSYTTRTDSIPDANEVDMGYHYPITIEATCDFDGDGDADLADFGILVSYWLEQYCHLWAWCEGADLDRDKDVDFIDYATFAQAYAPSEEGPPPPDTDPPEPDPSEWEIEPHPLSSSAIHMKAVTAYDPSGGVEYQFECVGGGGHSSDWQDSSEYTDTGLAALTEYTYTVRTRDVYENTGGYSEPRSATTLP